MFIIESDDFPLELEDALSSDEADMSDEEFEDIEENGEVIFEVDDGMGCNSLILHKGQHYWVDRHCGIYLVDEETVKDCVSQLT